MRDTLDFYTRIYEPLFKKNYTKSLNRAGVALKKFELFIARHKIKVENVIDVGCAWGKTLKYWKRRGVDVVGVDVAKRVVRKCQKGGHKCHVASATDLSIFEDKQFDLYMATDVYEHLRTKDLSHAMEEAIRITRRYFLIRPHPALDKRGRRNKKAALHLTVWDLDAWQKFFEGHGLNIINIGDDGEASYKNAFLLSVDKGN